MSEKLSLAFQRIRHIYPALFAVLPVLDNYAAIQYRVPFVERVVPVLVVVVAVIAVVYLLCRLILKKNEHALAVAGVIALLLFQPGFVSKLVGFVPFLDDRVGSVVVILLLLLGASLLIRRLDLKALAGLNSTAALLGLGAVLYYALILSQSAAAYDNVLDKRYENVRAASDKVNQADIQRPNIYHLILDGYARDDVLADFYNYDNSLFLAELRGLGFFVAEKSTSNYSQTILSLSSTLNMNYLEALEDPDVNRNNVTDLIQLIRYNRAAEFLRQIGYRWAYFDANFWGTYLTGAADRIYHDQQLGAYYKQVLSQSLASFFMTFAFTDRDQVKRVNYTLENLDRSLEIEGPVYTLAHVIAPHPPFVFNADGPIISGIHVMMDDGAHLPDYTGGYREQLNYLNQLVLNQVENIRRQDPGAVIIVQSDHGPGSKLDWNSDAPGEETLYERMSNLMAVFLPEEYRNKTELYDTMTPVNLLPIVFNAVFDTNFPTSEDRSFFSLRSHPFDYVEVPDVLIR